MRADDRAGGAEVTIDVGAFAAPSRVRAQAMERLLAVLARVPVRPLTARLTLVDENGPNGEEGLRCAVTVALPRRAVIRVGQVAEAPAPALARTLDALERRLERERVRRREGRRRPTKYFWARRLLLETA
jgi:hypothetical protein